MSGTVIEKPHNFKDAAQNRFSTPIGAYGFLLAYVLGKSENLQDEVIGFKRKELFEMEGFREAVRSLDQLRSAAAAIQSLSEDAEQVLASGFYDLFNSTLEKVEKYAGRLVIEVLQDEMGESKGIMYGAGSAWASEKGHMIEAAQVLFEMQLMFQDWEKIRALRKSQRQSD